MLSYMHACTVQSRYVASDGARRRSLHTFCSIIATTFLLSGFTPPIMRHLAISAHARTVTYLHSLGRYQMSGDAPLRRVPRALSEV